MEVIRCLRQANKRHCRMFNIKNVFVQWLNEIVVNSDVRFSTQKWKRIIVTYRNDIEYLCKFLSR